MGKLTTWLSQFTKGTRALYPFARAAVSEGIGRHQFAEMVRVTPGLKGQRQSVLNMYRQMQAAYKDIDTFLDQSNLRNKPIPELIPPSLGRQKRSYAYVVQAELFDPVSGSFYEQYLTINSSTILNVGDAFDDAMLDFGRYGQAELVTEGSIRIKEINHSINPVMRV